MMSHHFAKFGDRRRCGNGDTTFLVVEEENSKCWLKSSLLLISKAHDMPFSHTKSLKLDMAICYAILIVQY